MSFVIGSCQWVDNLRAEGWDNESIIKYGQYVSRRTLVVNTGRSCFRDSDKTKVYSAESSFLSMLPKLGKKNIEFQSYEEAEKYKNRILASKTWQKVSKRKNVTLIKKRDMGSRTASAGSSWGGKIQLCPRTGLNQYVLIHELTHSAGHMHHDVGFRQCLVKLVSRFMGADAGKMLKDSFKEKKLKMYRHSVVMAPEQWKALLYRAAKARKSLNAA